MVRAQAAQQQKLVELDQAVSCCRACPRLVEWRERVARERRKSFADQEYWGRPVAGFGDTSPGVFIVGLAPAAHGGNRTGRVFTGDRSGDWLFSSLHRVGLANQAASTDINDGLVLFGTRVAAAVRCAPPENKPTTKERDTCAAWLDREWQLVEDSVRVIVALGSFAWTASLALLSRAGGPLPTPRPRFGHHTSVVVGEVTVLGCFHPSQQNTFTGRLTTDMLDDVMRKAAVLAKAG